MGNPSVHKATSCTLLKNMKVVASYMLAVVGGNATPSVSDCKKILKAMNISLDADQEKRVEEMNGKDIHEVIAEGHKKLAKIPGGGAGGAAPAGAAPAGGAPAGGDAGGAAKKESSSDDDDAGVAAGGLFDDGGDDY